MKHLDDDILLFETKRKILADIDALNRANKNYIIFPIDEKFVIAGMLTELGMDLKREITKIGFSFEVERSKHKLADSFVIKIGW